MNEMRLTLLGTRRRDVECLISTLTGFRAVAAHSRNVTLVSTEMILASPRERILWVSGSSGT